MTPRSTGFSSPVAGAIETFLAHKRALGCRFRGEEINLRLLDRFLVERGIATVEEISPTVIDAFLASRPRIPPQSYNHLRGTIARCFKWLAVRNLVPRDPVLAKPRRVTRTRVPFLFDPATARRLIDAAAALPDNSFASRRGPTYRVIFALLYALGLRVGEVARLRFGDRRLHPPVIDRAENKIRKRSAHSLRTTDSASLERLSRSARAARWSTRRDDAGVLVRPRASHQCALDQPSLS